jgi:hypothetical protein
MPTPHMRRRAASPIPTTTLSPWAQLRDGIAYQKRTRKCYCCLICIAIVIILLLVAGLGSYFGGAFKRL